MSPDLKAKKEMPYFLRLSTAYENRYLTSAREIN
jgi:hypothetical protein